MFAYAYKEDNTPGVKLASDEKTANITVVVALSCIVFHTTEPYRWEGKDASFLGYMPPANC
jgi:hypothetical protein